MIFNLSYQSAKRILVILSALLLLWPSANINWGKDHWKDILESDAKGYYAYLPAIFIYQDLNFGFFESMEQGKYFNENIYYDYRYQFEGNTVNKYFMGTSVLEFPFFLVGHIWALSSDEWDADGYSKPYLVMINLAAIFYAIASLWILLTFVLPRSTTSLMLGVAMIFATNLFYYAVCEPGMSHVYSFFLVSVFVWAAQRLGTGKHFMMMGLSLGLIVLIRPTNGLVLLVLPFLQGNNWWDKLRSNLPLTLWSLVLIPSLIISIQPIVYYLQTGTFFVYSYAEEGFNWLQPQIWNALFSFKKGWFVYTPFMLLIIPALVGLSRKNWPKARLFLLFMVALLYVNFSWWNWWYGGSFSQRVMIDFYAIFFVLLAHWWADIKSLKLRWALSSYVLVCLLWCQFQTYQYRYEIIHWEEMTHDKYLSSLLKLPN